MIIGNIVTTEKIDNEGIYNVVDSTDNLISGIPTLYVGLDLTKSIKEDVDFLDRQIDTLTLWTFTRSESRKHHVLDIDNFKTYCLQFHTKSIKYVFVDTIKYNLTSIKKIINKIKSLDNIITFIYKGKYIYMFSDKYVFGIDTQLLTYIGLDINKLKGKITKLSSVLLEDEGILIEYKGYISRLGNQVKYIPYIYSIKNDK